MRIRHLLLSASLAVVSCQSQERFTQIVDVVPTVDTTLIGVDGDPEFDAMLASYQEYGPLHVMTYYGDFDDLIRRHHEEIMIYLATPAAQRPRRNCSMFRFGGGSAETLVGRNYDNVVSDVLVGWFYPVDGYASIGLIPLSEFGFGGKNTFSADNDWHRKLILNAPTLTIEGMNEKGVTVTLASLGRRTVDQLPDRRSRYLIHLVREILDHAAAVDEAVEIASRYNVFDNGREIISHHIFVADPFGSVVLEWRDGIMHVVPGTGDTQIVTNSDLLDTSEEARRGSCDRYRSLARRFEAQPDTLSWRGAMDALADVAQNNRVYVLDGQRRRISTQWSAVFDVTGRRVYMCTGRDYATVYRLAFPETAAGPK